MPTPSESLAEFNANRWRELEVSPFEERLRKVTRLVRRQPPGRLLDIGCGDGGFSAQFLADGWEVWGVDLVGDQIAKANDRGVRAQRQDISRGLDFPDAFFTTVVASEVIEHLVDTDLLIEEVRRTLKAGGVFLLTTANLASLNNRVRLLLGFYPTAMDYSSRQGYGHVRYYTMGTLTRQLKEHGFVIQRLSGSYVPLVPTRWTFHRGYPRIVLPLGRLLGDLIPALAMECIVECRRP